MVGYMRERTLVELRYARRSGSNGKLSERARRWESGIECLKRSGASWGLENKWETVIGE